MHDLSQLQRELTGDNKISVLLNQTQSRQMMLKMEACSTGQTELSRLMIPDSSKPMMSLAGSGFMMEEDHQNN